MAKQKAKPIESDYKASDILAIKNNLIDVLKKFEFKKEAYIIPHKKQRKTESKKLQEDILNHLKDRFVIFNWKKEYTPSEIYGDRIDIFGESDSNDIKIIIELDAGRKDQISSKFLSRSALLIDKNLIYITLCYNGTNNMSRNECLKYFEYCKILSEFMSKNSNLAKLYVGHFLELA